MSDFPTPSGVGAAWIVVIIALTKGLDSLLRLFKERRSGRRAKVDVAATVQDMAIEQMKELRLDLTAARQDVADLRQQVGMLRDDLAVTRALLNANNIPVPKLRSV